MIDSTKGLLKIFMLAEDLTKVFHITDLGFLSSDSCIGCRGLRMGLRGLEESELVAGIEVGE